MQEFRVRCLIYLLYPEVRIIVRIDIQTAVRIQKGNIMFLKEISSTVAQRNMKKLFTMACRAPTLLTRAGHSPETLVVMSKVKYAKLIKDANK